ncbi:hypothetical protein IQ209_02130 [Xenorhabdus sp. BG5]|nr:Rz1 family lipoprotein [Xenorhabdus sp. BG5]MBE8595347.1 hypothetical protein [Xenorhabdus sp. BG5]
MLNLNLMSLAILSALTLSACTSKPSVPCLKQLSPPAWMVQDPPDWRKTLNRIMYVSSENSKPLKPSFSD